jgi:hypothetical protein
MAHHNPNCEILLNRLEHVQEYSQGWRAKCPAHEGTSKGSLSIAEGDDGRVLLHCFGGCDVLTVLNVCGLEMADLFPARISHDVPPQQAQKWQELKQHRDWVQAAGRIQYEARILSMAWQDIYQGRPMTDSDLHRVMKAMEVITAETGKMNAA